MSDLYNQSQDEALSPVSDAPVDVLKPPRRVPTSRAARWIYQGFTVFDCGMGMSVGIALIAMGLQLINCVLIYESLVLNLLLSLFSLVFAAGYMAVADGGYRQRQICFGNYFAGFRKNMGQLLLAQAIYMGLIFAVVFIGSFLMEKICGAWLMIQINGINELNFDLILLCYLIILMFVLPLMLLVVYAPALIYFHDLKAWTAMKLSFEACLKNMLPLLWLWILLSLLLLLGFLMLVVGLLMVLPVLGYANYFSYRDIFLYEDEVISV